MINPNTDGLTHINIYSKGRTELGRLLSHFAHTPFTIDGITFQSVEGYWYWLGRQDDRLTWLHEFAAKRLGRELPIVNHLSESLFRDKIKLANIAKVYQHTLLKHALINSTLPFEHYYVYNGIAKDAGYEWIVKFWMDFRNYLKLTSPH